MKSKFMAAAAIAAASVAVAIPSSATAATAADVSVKCPPGVFDCVQALANYAYDTATNPPALGTLVDRACILLYGRPCPTP
jgi:hypothetical protein